MRALLLVVTLAALVLVAIEVVADDVKSCPANLDPIHEQLRYPGSPPFAASKKGKEPLARVVIQFLIRPDGTTADATVLESDSKLFERGAILTVLESRYAPQRTSCRHTRELTFEDGYWLKQ